MYEDETLVRYDMLVVSVLPVSVSLTVQIPRVLTYIYSSVCVYMHVFLYIILFMFLFFDNP